MADQDPNRRRAIAVLGAHASWAATPDRAARTAKARKNAPSSIEWHLARLPEKFDDCTVEQRYAAAEAAKKAYYARMALKSQDARRRRQAAS